MKWNIVIVINSSSEKLTTKTACVDWHNWSQFLNYWPITSQKTSTTTFEWIWGMYLPKNCRYVKLYRMARWVHIKIFNTKLNFLRLFYFPQKNDAIVPRSFYCSINKLPTIFVEMGGRKLPCKGNTRPRAAICRLWTKDNRYDKTFTVFHGWGW